MKHTALILAALCGLTACGTVPPQRVTVQPAAGGQPVNFTSGKDVTTTAKNAGLAFAAWYLGQLLKPAK